MPVTEAARHRRYEEARQAMSDESADTMMALLPPVGWGDVARTADLDRLREQLDARFDRIDERFAPSEARFDGLDERFEARLDQHADRLSAQFHKELLRTVLVANVGTAVAVGSLVLAAVKIA
jgi:hypothetical protein